MNFQIIIKITITTYITLFVLYFIFRNLITKIKTGKNIRAGNKEVFINTLLTTLIYAVSIISFFSIKLYLVFVPITYLDHNFVKIAGIILLYLSFILCIIASSGMKTSWRIGIIKDQKNELIQTGLYKYSRNPYYISYYISYLSLLLIIPSIILSVIIIITILSFHIMVLKEEKYLKNIHKDDYIDYCKKTPRYLFFK